MKTYIFHSDAGHGWLKVPMSEIKEFKIEDKISRFSYMKGDMVYLEEDCDAPLFIDKLEAEGQKFNYRVIKAEYSSIRGYPPYPQKKHQLFSKTNLNNLSSAEIKKRFHRNA